MSVVYSLVENEVKQTITIPEKVEVRELGEKDKVVKDITAQIAQAQGVIDTYTVQKTALQAKLDAINALK